MERRKFIFKAGAAAAVATTAGISTACSPSTGLKAGEVLHTVIFDLKHPIGSAEAKKFLTDGYNILTKVPGVLDFQVFRQCSPKNDYQYGFYMRFRNQADFDAYTAHPEHTKFVQERWDTEVSRFQESDFQTIL
ncbi:heme-degrading monooxygenase HmoA [Parabacteroides sp. PF5-5]|uniref:Dabb family protein n=1 Tax=unclassified Parabacteroides TaxID=2649774 RepID=UPI0024762781|nr:MULTISPECIES: Dabb family protein [unclassified Parabacteroides]MDH6304510.1 heme-degrading monooxygenase HmoA [Parabacteroides sp. PH5-39]MDH6315338.1 heme-degrading monooxygenase HmoA [Parabacteroides sp. PF5-13]MDH6319168.1 heme-degrading monooxygenase HmoA [Parabacteroides sp. PH5-13]MDH6322899.1 heme-degrading monooxygenase HmoA [Parabacteroides sp. PH5-8]MDH6326529.1 heme-degrading monooxygenase HmoA [Parabacteroides sp. PH5-41]